MPSEIGQLTGLTSLSFLINVATAFQTSSLPSEFGKLTNLVSLDIETPSSISEFSSTLPTEIGKLTKLTSLVLSFGFVTLQSTADFYSTDVLGGITGHLPSGETIYFF